MAREVVVVDLRVFAFMAHDGSCKQSFSSESDPCACIHNGAAAIRSLIT